MLVIVTGASKGFGRSLAVEMAKAVSPVTMVLVSRSAAGLAVTQELVTKVNAAAQVRVLVADVGDLSALDANCDAVFEAARGGRPAGVPYTRAVLFHNAGSLGELCRWDAMSSLETLRSALDLNVTSCMWMSRRFLEFVRTDVAHEGAAPSLASAVVNVSSLAALQPFPTWGTYSVTKAARDMMCRVIATEFASSGTPVLSLNYAPGPMLTDIVREARSSAGIDAGIAQYFNNLEETHTFVDSDVSAAKCVRLVLAGSYESGSHIDFFDS